MSTELEPTDSLRAGDIRFAYQRAGLGGLEKLFVDHFMRREKVGLFDANSVSDADIEHYARAVQRPGALRCPFSCYPPLPRYDKASLAEDVHGTMAALGFERYAVCGHDIGAMVALALAFTHREAVTRVAILDAPMPGWSQWEANFIDPMVWHFAFHMKRDLPERLIYGRELDYVSTFFFDRTFNHGAFPIEEVEMYARAFAQPGNTRGGLEWYRAFPLDHANGLGWKQNPLTMPVLALGGEHRWGPRIVGMLEEFATNVSGGSIAECGHWLVEERPTETTEALLGFFAP